MMIPSSLMVTWYSGPATERSPSWSCSRSLPRRSCALLQWLPVLSGVSKSNFPRHPNRQLSTDAPGVASVEDSDHVVALAHPSPDCWNDEDERLVEILVEVEGEHLLHPVDEGQW